MTCPPEVEYAVVLVFPGFGTERENAETIVECALDWLNTHKDKPGFRFAPPVSAHLEIVADADEARERIDADEGVATVLMHDLDDDERDALLRYCRDRQVPACITVDAPRRTGQKGPWKVVFREKRTQELPAHQLAAGTLTDPIGEDEEDNGGRVSEAIAVLALGVMEHHWRKTHG
jgi:hypothetical protein